MTTREKLQWSVVVILGPIIIALIVMAAGALLGIVELSLILVVWVVGLFLVWRR